MGFNRRRVAIKSESGRRNALLVHLISFFMRNRDEKWDKKNEARRDMPIRIINLDDIPHRGLCPRPRKP
ncbi:MAG: hypothetical protein QMD80_01375 [archaeon]|nr:hypothetical protein [archaeon]